MSLEHAILGFLSERPRSGYDLKARCFDGFARPLWTADQAQIYRTLGRLQKAGMVTTSRHRSQGRPDRIVFDITATGRDELTQWLESPAIPQPRRDAFAMQLVFSASMSDADLLRLLEGRRALHRERLDELRERSDELDSDHSISRRSLVLKHTALDGAVAREAATIEWLDACIEAVREGALPKRRRSELVGKDLSGA